MKLKSSLYLLNSFILNTRYKKIKTAECFLKWSNNRLPKCCAPNCIRLFGNYRGETVQSPNFVNTRFAVTVQESAITPIAGALFIYLSTD